MLCDIQDKDAPSRVAELVEALSTEKGTSVRWQIVFLLWDVLGAGDHALLDRVVTVLAHRDPDEVWARLAAILARCDRREGLEWFRTTIDKLGAETPRYVLYALGDAVDLPFLISWGSGEERLETVRKVQTLLRDLSSLQWRAYDRKFGLR